MGAHRGAGFLRAWPALETEIHGGHRTYMIPSHLRPALLGDGKGRTTHHEQPEARSQGMGFQDLEFPLASKN